MQDDEPVPDEPSDKETAEDDEVNDVGKDKLIKAVKPKGKTGEKDKAKGGKKK